MTAIAELDEIIAILEATIPANPNSPGNMRQRKRLERSLAEYFGRLERAFPYSKLSEIYSRHVTESIGSESGRILDPLLAAFDPTLTTEISGQLVETYMSGQAEMITWGTTKGGVPIAYEGPPMQYAIDWADDHGATLVKGLDEETKKRLAHTISDGIAKKRGVPGLARDIRKEFADMSRYRSQLIARTETATALSQASLDSMKDMGIEGKEWVTAGDDRVSLECQGNAAEGVIPSDQAFSGGVMAPPQHPDCRCAIAPARLPAGVRPPEEREFRQVEKNFVSQYIASKVEYGQAISARGNLLTKKGLANKVQYSPEELAQLKDSKMFIHNHPKGGTFSGQDILFGKEINVGKLMAVDGTYNHTITPVTTWAEVTPGRYASTFRMRQGFERRELRSIVKVNPRITQKELDTLWFDRMHHLVEELAPRYGLKYTRERR